MMQPLYWDLQRLSCKAPFNAQYRTMAEGIPVPKWFVQRNLGAKAKKKMISTHFFNGVWFGGAVGPHLVETSICYQCAPSIYTLCYQFTIYDAQLQKTLSLRTQPQQRGTWRSHPTAIWAYDVPHPSHKRAYLYLRTGTSVHPEKTMFRANPDVQISSLMLQSTIELQHTTQD